MDTYENDELTQQPNAEEQVQPEQESNSDGFYHGAGAGVTESTCAPTEPVQEQVPENAAEEIPEQIPAQKPKRHIGKKIVKGVVAGAAALALVVSGCAISVGFMNQYWKYQNNNLIRNFEERLAVLQAQLDSYKDKDNTYIAVTEEGLTPSQIYQNNIDSVVALNCVIKSSNAGQLYSGNSSGSGFVLTQDGYIVTNHHVIDGASSISVVFADGRKMDATLIGSDATNDIALVKVEANDLQAVKLGSSDDLRVGDQVVAIGNALGELSFSLTAGYVSGMDRDVTTDGTVINMIQTDVAINSGNSGGPLFNGKGEVIGITSAKYSGTTSSGASIEGISFAIPINDVQGMLEDLRDYGYIKSAYLGVMVRNVPSELLEYGLPSGVQVESVVAGGSAARAGVRAKDIITNLGGYEIENMTDLTRALRQFEAGESSTIAVWRAGQTIYLEIVFQEKPQG